jgi:ectoine hydroxylase-related dioxygenase (phytanoyl-CoA dioxygenase family)
MQPEEPSLRDADIEFFRDHGFLSVPSSTTAEEIAKIKSTLLELFEKRSGENEGAYTDKIQRSGQVEVITASEILNPVNYVPWLRKTQCFRNALKMAKQLLGEDASCFFDFAVLKKPAIGSATPWHQDEAFRDPGFESNEVTVWVPLQDVRMDNGCMQFIPRSHLRGILTHDSPNHEVASTALECVDAFDESTAVVCPLTVGGCSIHHPRVLHGTAPNRSESPRLAYIMVFSLPLKLQKKRQHFVWLDQKRTTASARKRRWMRYGGGFITIWRRLRRGESVRFPALVYVFRRASRLLRKAN